MVCARCQAELDPAVGVCPRCGAAVESGSSSGEPAWRRQIRETIQRRKQLREKQLAKRDDEGRQLSIFPESPEPSTGDEDDLDRKRRAEIRARVEQKMSKPRRSKPRFADAGDVTIPVRSSSGAAATAPALDAPLTRTNESEPFREFAEEPVGADDGQAGCSEAPPRDWATPGERVLAGLIDIGIVSLMLVTLLYLTSQVGGHSLRMLPSSAVAALAVIGALLASGYFLFFWGLSGQTLGNLLTGSRVIGPDGGALGLSRAVLRGFGVILSVLPLGAGLIGLWSDDEHRCWHDRLASTKVIRS